MKSRKKKVAKPALWKLFKILEDVEKSIGIADETDPKKKRVQNVTFVAFALVTSFFLANVGNSIWLFWKNGAFLVNIYLCLVFVTVVFMIFVACFYRWNKKSFRNSMELCKSWHQRQHPLEESHVQFCYDKCSRKSLNTFIYFCKHHTSITIVLATVHAIVLSLIHRRPSSIIPGASMFWIGEYRWYYEPLELALELISSFFFLKINGLIFGIICVNFIHLMSTLEAMTLIVRRLSHFYFDSISLPKFYQTVKVVVDMHSDLISHQKFCFDLISNIFLVWEFACYGLLLIIYSIISTSPDQLMLVFAVSGAFFPYFLVCYCNEKLDDSYSQFRDALFSMKWYSLKPRERRTLINVLIMADRTNLLQAGPFHVVGYEGLMDMLNRAYSYGVFLKDIV